MHLCDVQVGSSAVINSLAFPPLFSKRLRDIGFCEGERVECVSYALLRSPILYYIKGSFVALRRSDASRIGVRDEE